MNKSKKNLAVLCTAMFVIMGMWVMLSVHCQAAETNNDEKQQPQTIRIGSFEDTFNYAQKWCQTGLWMTSSCSSGRLYRMEIRVCEM